MKPPLPLFLIYLRLLLSRLQQSLVKGACINDGKEQTMRNATKPTRGSFMSALLGLGQAKLMASTHLRA